MSPAVCQRVRGFVAPAPEIPRLALRPVGSAALALVLAVCSCGCGGQPEDTAGTPGQAQPADHAAAASGEMISIPGGQLDFGKDPQAGEPGRVTTVAPFAIGKTEVTVAAYAQCVAAGRCSEPHDDWAECNWARRQERSSHPINCVDWNQAEAYCAWAGKRLPSEEEWEFAARATDARTYPWGEAAPSDQLCWEDNPARGVDAAGTCPVGEYGKGASPYGVQDMSGNVWEWTTGSETMPDGGALRALRGGGWSYDRLGPPEVRALERQTHEPGHYASDLGLRCAGTN